MQKILTLLATALACLGFNLHAGVWPASTTVLLNYTTLPDGHSGGQVQIWKTLSNGNDYQVRSWTGPTASQYLYLTDGTSYTVFERVTTGTGGGGIQLTSWDAEGSPYSSNLLHGCSNVWHVFRVQWLSGYIVTTFMGYGVSLDTLNVYDWLP